MSIKTELQNTITAIAQQGKGILAADESTGTIQKRFQAHNIECTEENRRAYRTLLFTTPNISEFISGVIFYEETLFQKSYDNTPLPEVLSKQGIVPGIKVDKGLIALPSSPEEKITQGLDGLAERLVQYKQAGARFAKWREVFSISDKTPTTHGIETNAELMALYASICQSQGIVPIVEPELLMDGAHSIERCAEVTETILARVFNALHRHHVDLELIILKPNMVLAGQDAKKNAPEEVGEHTVRILRRTVPAAVPTINFLSGGQSAVQATENLNAINTVSMPRPWHLSYSYGRALQETCLAAWKGNPENVNLAQQEFYKRAKLNTAAVLGKYSPSMEK